MSSTLSKIIPTSWEEDADNLISAEAIVKPLLVQVPSLADTDSTDNDDVDAIIAATVDADLIASDGAALLGFWGAALSHGNATADVVRSSSSDDDDEVEEEEHNNSPTTTTTTTLWGTALLGVDLSAFARGAFTKADAEELGFTPLLLVKDDREEVGGHSVSSSRSRNSSGGAENDVEHSFADAAATLTTLVWRALTGYSATTTAPPLRLLTGAALTRSLPHTRSSSATLLFFNSNGILIAATSIPLAKSTKSSTTADTTTTKKGKKWESASESLFSRGWAFHVGSQTVGADTGKWALAAAKQVPNHGKVRVIALFTFPQSVASENAWAHIAAPLTKLPWMTAEEEGGRRRRRRRGKRVIMCWKKNLH